MNVKHRTSSTTSTNESESNEEELNMDFKLSNANLDSLSASKNRSKLLSSLSSDLDDDDDLEIVNLVDPSDEDRASYSSRRETVIFKRSEEQNLGNDTFVEGSLFEFQKEGLNNAEKNIKSNSTEDLSEIKKTNKPLADRSKSLVNELDCLQVAASKAVMDNQQAASSMACEVASLSSMTSNYSQFDFINRYIQILFKLYNTFNTNCSYNNVIIISLMHVLLHY